MSSQFVLTPAQFIIKWTGRFAYNAWEKIDDAAFREFTSDLAATFGTPAVNVPAYLAGSDYTVGYLVRYPVAGSSEAFYYALLDGKLPAPTGQATDANWKLVPGPVPATQLYQYLTLAEAQGLEGTGVVVGRRYAVTGPWNGSADDQLVYLDGLKYTFRQRGTLLHNDGSQQEVDVDVAAGTYEVAAGVSEVASPTIAPGYDPATRQLHHDLRPGGVQLNHLSADTIAQLQDPTTSLPVTADTLNWHEADTNHALGFLKNKVPAGVGIYDLASTQRNQGGPSYDPTIPLRLTANALNGYPAVSFDNAANAGSDRVTYNCAAFGNLVGGARPGTVTFLLRCRSTAPAGSSSGRVLGGFGSVQVGVNYDVGGNNTVPAMGADFGLLSVHFTWLGRAFVHVNGRYVGTLPSGNDFVIGNEDGGTMRWFDNFTGEVVAFLLTQDAGRSAGLLHENYLRAKYDL